MGKRDSGSPPLPTQGQKSLAVNIPTPIRHLLETAHLGCEFLGTSHLPCAEAKQALEAKENPLGK